MAHLLRSPNSWKVLALSKENRVLALGSAVFLAALGATASGWLPFGTLELALLAAFWLIVPGALILAGAGAGKSAQVLHQRLLQVHPAAASFASLAMLLPTGALATLFSSVWALFALGMAALGGLRFFGRAQRFRADEFAIDAGLMYPLIAVSAFVPGCAGLPYLGFHAPWPMLTAMHFHYAGLLVPVVAGLIGRMLDGRFARAYAASAYAVVFGSAAIGLGILFSQVLETLSVVVLSAGLWGLSGVALAGVLPQARNALVRAGLAVSALVFFVSMPLAIAYSVGELTGNVWITLPQMIDTHGRMNFVLFGVLGTVSWLALKPTPRAVAHSDAGLLTLLRDEPLTYALSDGEDGMKVHTLEKVIGTDVSGALFDQAGAILLRYEFYPESVISSVSDFSLANRTVATGDRILLRLHLLHLFGVSFVNFPVLVHVVDAVDQPREKRMTYCTTRWHLAKGTCTAQLQWRDDGAVVLSLRSVETPVNRFLRLPVVKPVFRLFLDRALRKGVANVMRAVAQ